MADTATTTSADGPEGETPNQRQARLRREKLKKKMADQGEDRLAKIKALNGGVAPPDEVLGGPAAAPKIIHDDPAEVDISTIRPTSTSASARTPQATGDDFAAALRRAQQQQQAMGAGGSQDDQMMQMMQQMMGSLGGGAGGNESGAGGMPQIPPALQAMLGGKPPGSAQQDQAAAVAEAGSSYLWKIVHAVFAFSLAVYIALNSTFNGTQISRVQSAAAPEGTTGVGPQLFIIFTSVELVLQSSRYFLERGQLQGGGMLATVANSGFIPEPYNHYVRVLGRYITIAQTIFADAMVVVFVLGCLAWWHNLTLTTADPLIE